MAGLVSPLRPQNLPRLLMSMLIALAMSVGVLLFVNGTSQAAADDAPVISSVTASGTNLTVDFSRPADSLLDVLNYEYSTNGGVSWSVRSPLAITSPLSIEGLTAGSSYQIALRVISTVGAGSASPVVGVSLAPAASATPSVTPSSTDGPSATPGATGSATPAPSGSSSGTSSATPGASASPTGTSSATPGGSVSASPTGSGTATATSSASPSPTGTSSASPSPTGTSTSSSSSLPAAPTDVKVVSGNGSIEVSWTASASNTPIAAYTVTSTPGGFTCRTVKTSCTVNGLTNDTPYTFVVNATNSFGTSLPSLKSRSVRPLDNPEWETDDLAPRAPEVTNVDVGNANALVTFDPASGPIARAFTVTSRPAGLTCKATLKHFCTVTGLTNDEAYAFTVKAANGAGFSPSSPRSEYFTPTDDLEAPGTPSIVALQAGDGEVTVSLSSGSGGPAKQYRIRSSPEGLLCESASTTCTVGGLENGKSYTFTASAINRLGTSSASGASSEVTPNAR
ncbi:MAG: fibronectin type III domain-containing protein [Actinomycetota bacterium]|nr:fibronectin type III domain-containing protein [Actinomycetota bacterium]